jgi:hypothetical protein
MSVKGIAVMAALGLLTLPALAGAASSPAATDVRFGDHPTGFIRVVVDFTGTISAREVEAGSLWAKTANVSLTHPGVTTHTSGATGYGVGVAIQPGTQKLHIALSFAAHRFKYLSYAVVTGNRLSIDLWKSAPPPLNTHTCPGLTLQSPQVTPGVVGASGTEHGVFENQFQVVVRGAHGTVLARKHVGGPGAWNATLNYHASHRQVGTVEVVAFSPKDGALSCIAQKRVTLPAS